MSCSICGRAAEDELCEFHRIAYENVRETYKAWKEAADFSWVEYLSEIAKNPLTGVWSREVAKKMLEEEDGV